MVKLPPLREPSPNDCRLLIAVATAVLVDTSQEDELRLLDLYRGP